MCGKALTSELGIRSLLFWANCSFFDKKSKSLFALFKRANHSFALFKRAICSYALFKRVNQSFALFKRANRSFALFKRVNRSFCFYKKRIALFFSYKSKAKKWDINMYICPVHSFLYKKKQSPLLKRANRTIIKSELLYHKEQITLVLILL